jgi:hypothetical protein
VVARRTRLAAAMTVGMVAAVFTWLCLRRPHFTSDFAYTWNGARVLLAGRNPYDAFPGILPDGLFYPMPTLLLSATVAWLPQPIAGAILFGLASAALAYTVTRDGLWRLYLFAGAPFLMAANLAQWSPLVMLAAFLPAAGWVATLKPNIGLAVLGYRPSWRAAVSAALALAVGFAVQPSWLVDWLRETRLVESHPAPLRTLPGLLLLLALLKWRRPEARLLLLMGLVPQLLFFSDQLPLSLVARTRRELVLLGAASQVGFVAFYLSLRTGDQYVLKAAPFVLASTYLPALLLVLRRPNEGPLPDWLERALARLPSNRMRSVASSAPGLSD